MNLYCAIPSRNEPGKWRVATIGPCGDFHPCGSLRSFESFDEANTVAIDTATGKYTDYYPAGEFVNMR